METELTNIDGSKVTVKKEEVKGYYGADYPMKDSTLIVLKSGAEFHVKECFKIVDDLIDL